MRPPRLLDPDETAEILEESVHDNALAVLSIQRRGTWRLFKSRFLENDPKRRYFVLDSQETHGASPPELQPGEYVGVNVRYRSHKLLFSTVVEARGKFLLDEGRSIPAVRYRWPQAVTEMQRRAYHRTPVPAGTCVPVNLWRGGVPDFDSETPDPTSVIAGQALDISCGGMLVRTPLPRPPQWPDDQLLGAELHLPDGRLPIRLNASFRAARMNDAGGACIAIQFLGLEMSADGRSILQRLSRCVQRFHSVSRANVGREGSQED